MGTGRRAEADARAVQILENRTIGDALIEHVDLEILSALGERLIELQNLENPRADDERRWEAWSFLDVIRRSPLLKRIAEAGAVDLWSELILRLVEASHFTFGPLFEQRVAGYGSRTLFELPGTNSTSKVSWHQVAGRVGLIARGLLALRKAETSGPVAILSENRLEMALTDLACLTTGIVDVMIPANATEADVGYILEHSGAATVIASNTVQLKKIAAHRERLPRLAHVIVFDGAAATARDVLAFEEVLGLATQVSSEDLGERRATVRISDLATVMYTSGTTGRPKGIRSPSATSSSSDSPGRWPCPRSARTIAFCVFCLCFTPSVVFSSSVGASSGAPPTDSLESPSLDALVRDMGSYRPTVFISVPMKWIQLYDRIRQEVDIETPGIPRLRRPSRRSPAGRSAGAFPPPATSIRRSSSSSSVTGIELMSGFGMTEATGGITMTPPGA